MFKRALKSVCIWLGDWVLLAAIVLVVVGIQLIGSFVCGFFDFLWSWWYSWAATLLIVICLVTYILKNFVEIIDKY